MLIKFSLFIVLGLNLIQDLLSKGFLLGLIWFWNVYTKWPTKIWPGSGPFVCFLNIYFISFIRPETFVFLKNIGNNTLLYCALHCFVGNWMCLNTQSKLMQYELNFLVTPLLSILCLTWQRRSERASQGRASSVLNCLQNEWKGIHWKKIENLIKLVENLLIP